MKNTEIKTTLADIILSFENSIGWKVWKRKEGTNRVNTSFMNQDASNLIEKLSEVYPNASMLVGLPILKECSYEQRLQVFDVIIKDTKKILRDRIINENLINPEYK